MALPLPLAKLRNRLTADARFQQWASRFPLTRGVARGRARRLFDLATGFVQSHVLAASIELGLVEQLRDGPVTPADLRAALKLEADALDALLVAAEGIGLVERRGGLVLLGQTGAELLGNPGVAAMVAHHGALARDLLDPSALFRRPPGGGALQRFWPYAGGGTGDFGPYSALMAASQPMVATQALAAHDFGRHRLLMDVGGGEGAFLEAVAAAHPRLALRLFDLPEVAARARARLGDRADVVAGSFRDGTLPSGADAISLVRILHDHDDAVAIALLAGVHAALPPAGTLILVEPMAGTAGALAVQTYFAIYLRAMGSGRPRTADEIGLMLRGIGFVEVRERPTPLPLVARVLVARKRG
jgi:demethylspheroidene O-methyltransferase